MKWFFAALGRYFDFSGRSRRKEYWFFGLWYVLFAVFVYFTEQAMFSGLKKDEAGVLTIIYELVMFIPGLSVAVRRLHDTGRSGWMVLIMVIPVVGIIWYLVLMFRDSTRGDNEYGPNPKGVQNPYAYGRGGWGGQV